MFTGIVETSARVVSAKEAKKALRLVLRPLKKIKGVDIGESIAVNGVCLTVVKRTASTVAFDVIPETLRCSNLGRVVPGSHVNIERSLKYGDRLHGHYVLGHAEGTGKILRITKRGKDVEFLIAVDAKLRKYIAAKGCISLDGISLTVGRVTRGAFSVYLIPHTIRITNLRFRKTGDIVNIETDILLRHRRLTQKVLWV